MTVTAKCLLEAKHAENAQTTQYTATAVKTIVDKFTVFNGTAGAVTFKCNLVPSGGAAGATNLKLSRSIAVDETYTCPELVGQILNAGDFVSTLAGAAASLVIRISGREIT